MKFFWCNNSSSIVGGTLQATHSMCSALPDCEHAVWSFGGEFGEDAKQAFASIKAPDGTKTHVQLHSGVSTNELASLIREFKSDVVVFQNTSSGRLPNSIGGALPVYYQHSAFKAATAAKEHFPKNLRFVVSKHLAGQVRAPESEVLYQPVTMPEELPEDHWYDDANRTVGRICTPIKAKWHRDEWEPYFVAGLNVDGRMKAELIGAGDDLDLTERYRIRQPSYAMRGVLHDWDYLLYTSSLEESYGRVVCEAQRCGTVPIVSKRGGFVEQIDHGKTGFLVETPDDVAEAFEALSDEKTLLQLSAQAIKAGDARGGLTVWREKFLGKLSE